MILLQIMFRISPGSAQKHSLGKTRLRKPFLVLLSGSRGVGIGSLDRHDHGKFYHGLMILGFEDTIATQQEVVDPTLRRFKY